MTMNTQQHTGTEGFFEMIREEGKLRNQPRGKVKAHPGHPEERVALKSFNERCDRVESFCLNDGLKRLGAAGIHFFNQITSEAYSFRDQEIEIGWEVHIAIAYFRS